MVELRYRASPNEEEAAEEKEYYKVLILTKIFIVNSWHFFTT